MIHQSDTYRHLKSIGLTRDDALVYGSLLEHGTQKSREIQQSTGLTKSLVYKSLESLEVRGLVETIKKPGKISIFKPGNPTAIQDLVRQKEKDLIVQKSLFNQQLPTLLSQYLQTLDRPEVRFFHGQDGIAHVFDDILSAQSIVRAYIDADSVLKYAAELNASYSKERDHRGTYKKMILVDTPEIRHYMDQSSNPLLEVRYVESAPFESTLQMYDGKLAYMTFTEDNSLGIIIQDQRLYSMHTILFDLLFIKSSA